MSLRSLMYLSVSLLFAGPAMISPPALPAQTIVDPGQAGGAADGAAT